MTRLMYVVYVMCDCDVDTDESCWEH